MKSKLTALTILILVVSVVVWFVLQLMIAMTRAGV